MENLNIEDLRLYCITKPFTSESFPFDQTTLVFKVMDKMYAMMSTEGNLFLNLKCNPDKSLEMREKYAAIKPGYHMNKKHWNTVEIDGSISSELIFLLIDHSYDLVVSKLPKKEREKLQKKK